MEYRRFRNLEEANQFYTNLGDGTKWQEEKSKEKSTISVLGPVTKEVFSAVLQISEADLNALFQLEKNGFSKPIPAKDGFLIFRLTHKETVSESAFDEKAKTEYRARFIERRKQKLFFDWWNDLMKRAAIEKFEKGTP